MEIIIKGESKEIADLVLTVQSRQDDSPGEYEALKERRRRRGVFMFKKELGWMIWVYVKNQIEPIDHEFCLTKEEAERARERAFEEIDDVETVTLDKVIYDCDSGEFEAA